MMYSFLMIGQSNMAGRGKKSEAPVIKQENKLFMLRNGKFIALSEPVNFDRPFSGTCLATSFAHAFSADHPEDTVGLIPAADGGSSLEDWRVGGELYTHAVELAKLAMRNSTLMGFLWHQGEAECGSDRNIETYESRFLTIMDAMKAELELPEDFPILIGGLGDYLAKRAVSPALINYGRVNEKLCHIARRHAGYRFVSAVGLTSNSDYLHFNAASLHEFGLRYYRAYAEGRSLLNQEFEGTEPIPTTWSEDDIDSETASIHEKMAALAALLAAGRLTKEEYDSRQKQLMAIL